LAAPANVSALMKWSGGGLEPVQINQH